jgi:hypothetical protein
MLPLWHALRQREPQGWLGLFLPAACWPLNWMLPGCGGYFPFALELFGLRNLLRARGPELSRLIQLLYRRAGGGLP